MFAILGLAFFWAAVPGSTAREKPEIIFSHRLHTEDVGVECEVCHAKAGESKSGLDNLMPEKKVCLVCHEDDVDKCEKCHRNKEKPRAIERITAYSPKFNHAVHLEKGAACERCHSGVSKSDSASTEHIPGMAVCMQCHDGIQAGKDCIICHEHPRGRLPEDHILPLWQKHHGDEARIDNGTACIMCHNRNDCQECHQGDNLSPRAHPPGFEYKHGIEIRTGRTECAACHEDRAFCIECHTERQVYPRSHQRASWANDIPGSGGSHKIQALINIENCAACHTDEPDSDPVCAACHGR
ncbi:MAG TPA: cytochrome c3 family protein [archaeon]|nr:cytochrome c3 family protein [archaeon]